MGLLDQLLGEVLGRDAAGSQRNQLLDMTMSFVQNYPGGLAGLVQQFTNAGYEQQARSWVAPGQNMPLSADDLARVLGRGNVQSMGRFTSAVRHFAQAYVIAHEVGHHVQNLVGIAAKVDSARRRLSTEDANALSVRMELQADCLAGVWAYHANRDANLLEPGDIEEGLAAASAIGDDRIQKQAQGYTVPESWTHGSSAMRVGWLRRGLQSGNQRECDTFSAEHL